MIRWSVGSRREAVAERAPDVELVARLRVCEQAGHLAEHEIDDVDRGRLAGGVEHHVVKRERPAQQRIVEPGEPQHQELARHDSPRDLGTREAHAIRVAGQPDVLDESARGPGSRRRRSRPRGAGSSQMVGNRSFTKSPAD